MKFFWGEPVLPKPVPSKSAYGESENHLIETTTTVTSIAHGMNELLQEREELEVRLKKVNEMIAQADSLGITRIAIPV